jgi:hypothetical protein
VLIHGRRITRTELAAMNRCDRFQAIGVAMLRGSVTARRGRIAV